MSNKKLDEDFIISFNETNLFGLTKIDRIVMDNLYSFFDLKDYYTRYIRYGLDDDKRKGLKVFLEKICTIHLPGDTKDAHFKIQPVLKLK